MVFLMKYIDLCYHLSSFLTNATLIVVEEAVKYKNRSSAWLDWLKIGEEAMYTLIALSAWVHSSFHPKKLAPFKM